MEREFAYSAEECVYGSLFHFSTGRGSSCLLGQWLCMEFIMSDHVISTEPVGQQSHPRKGETNEFLLPIGSAGDHVI